MKVSTTTHLYFAATIFAGATLLFACQPMIARMIVPLLGGAPAVWIVCSLCFQMLLLAGYAYAHFVGTRFPVRVQVMLQLVLVGAVFLVMPVSVNEETVQRLTAGHPTVGLLLLLLQTIGLPFFVLSTSSPLLQRWFAELGERDPYHLYAASNAGSMVALLGYPLLVEPLLAVRVQSRALHTAFAVYAVLVVVCAIVAVRRPASSLRVETTPAPPQVRVTESTLPPNNLSQSERFRERLVWIGLSFAPSSLLLGATEYVTTDIASVPLLWVIPLALYLMSFIIAFAKRQILRPALVSRVLALVASIVTALMLADVTGPSVLVVATHMLLLLLASVVCHRGLAERRPHVSRLTEFYLLLSIGGVLGGAFNGLLAPFLFDDLIEYPIAIGLVCLGRAAVDPTLVDRKMIARDVALGVALGLVTYGLVRFGMTRHGDPSSSATPTSNFGWMFGVPIVFAFIWSNRPIRFAVAIGGLLLAGMSHGGSLLGTTLWADRGFFGVLKVMRDRDSHFLLLVSGRAMQGKQSLDPAQARIPLAYYYPTGPAGQVLGPVPGIAAPRDKAPRDGDKNENNSGSLPPRRVGVIGLGVGSLAAYARPKDDWTFFEINPAVVDVARRHFTYLKAAEEEQLATVHIEIGDARQRLREGLRAAAAAGGGAGGNAERSEGRFDVLVLDAFSSDAVPIHLVTREALAVYRRTLRPGGLLLVHVSNDHVRLPPVFGALAREAGMVAIGRRDETLTAAERAQGKDPSEWVVLTDAKAELDLLVRTSKEWKVLEASPSQSVWTDDYANVLGALRF